MATEIVAGSDPGGEEGGFPDARPADFTPEELQFLDPEEARFLDPEERRAVLAWLRSPGPNASVWQRTWWRATHRLWGKPFRWGVQVEVRRRVERHQFEEPLARGIRNDLHVAPERARTLAHAWVEGRIQTYAEVAGIIARDIVLAPLLASVGLLLVGHFNGWMFDWFIPALLLMCTAWIVWKGEYWVAWLPWFPSRQRVAFAPVTNAMGSLFALTASFAAVTTILASRGWLAVEPSTRSVSVWNSLAFFIWHLLDSVPLLEIPDTLNWKLDTRFGDHFGGSLLLAYKLLVIIPVIRAMRSMLQRRRDSASEHPRGTGEP